MIVAFSLFVCYPVSATNLLEKKASDMQIKTNNKTIIKIASAVGIVSVITALLFALRRLMAPNNGNGNNNKTNPPKSNPKKKPSPSKKTSQNTVTSKTRPAKINCSQCGGIIDLQIHLAQRDNENKLYHAECYPKATKTQQTQPKLSLKEKIKAAKEIKAPPHIEEKAKKGMKAITNAGITYSSDSESDSDDDSDDEDETYEHKKRDLEKEKIKDSLFKLVSRQDSELPEVITETLIDKRTNRKHLN